MDYQEFSQNRKRYPYDPELQIDKEDRFLIQQLDQIHKEVSINTNIQGTLRDKLDKFTQLNQYQTHIFETNQDNSKDLITINESLNNDHAVSTLMKKLTTTKSPAPIFIDPKVKLDAEVIEARYQLRTEEDQERIHCKVEEERQMKEALTFVSRVTFKNKYGYDDYEEDNQLSHHIKPGEDDVEMAQPAPFDSFSSTYQQTPLQQLTLEKYHSVQPFLDFAASRRVQASKYEGIEPTINPDGGFLMRK